MKKDLTWLKDNLIAHRGLHSKDLKIPENSMTAFKNALEKGYSIECDVNILKDNEVVVFHDHNLKRMFDTDLELDQLTYDDLKAYKLKNGETIPKLTDLLDLVDGKAPLLIELKPHGNVKALTHAFMDIMKSYKGAYAVFSFHPKVVYILKKHYPDIIRGQIAKDFVKSKSMAFGMRHILTSMFFNHFTKPDFISYHIEAMPNKHLDYYKKKGLTIISFSARNQAQFDFVKAHYDNTVFEYFDPKEKVL